MACQLCYGQTVTDIDGNIYHSKAIGPQVWLKENLRTTHFNDGTLIPTTSGVAAVDSSAIFQWFYNNDTNNINRYGRLYTWFSLIGTRNVCPLGWHVPSDSEWLALGTYLGGDSIAGDALKDTGTSYWAVTDSNVTNAAGFSGRGGGFRGNPPSFLQQGHLGMYWSVTPWGSSAFQRAYCYKLQDNLHNLEQTVSVANCGLSVRCLQGSPTSSNDIHKSADIVVYPNPVTDILHISNPENNKLQLEIKDATGKSVYSSHLIKSQSEIDLSMLSKGVYIISLEGKDARYEQKLIKE